MHGMDTAANCGLRLSEQVSEVPQVMTTDTVRECRFVGWLGFNGTLSTQVAAISCLRKFTVY